MSGILLELDLTVPPTEAPPTDPVAAMFTRRRPLLRDLVEGLRLAADDPEVVGLVAHIGGHGPSLAQSQELAEAVRHFAGGEHGHFAGGEHGHFAGGEHGHSAGGEHGHSAGGGKPTIAWAETFGELGPATVPYLLGSAFDELWLQPSGDLGLTGLVAEAVFVKDALAKLGIVPQISARREYKTAAETFVANEMTDAHREAATQLAASAMRQIVEAIARHRKLTTSQVRALVDEAPLSATTALDSGLVDRLGYRDEVFRELRQRFGEPRLRYVHRYRRAHRLQPQRAVHRLKRRPAIAIIHATGDIHLGRTVKRGPTGSSIGSDSLGAVIRAAVRDPDVRGIVLRIDSPGGSYIASDTIRREVLRARESGKPFVVSMGTIAASGGYFVSMAAGSIVALPGTLTGSIGVFGGKAVVRDLLDRLGIHRDGVFEGQNARMFSSYQRFSGTQWERLEAWLDRVYEDFTAKVAADRDLDPGDVESVAKGRVWTGADAHSNGLVDELGGLERAISIACERAGLHRAEADVRTVPRLGLVERFRSPESSEDLPAASAAGALAGPLDWLAAMLGVPPRGVLTPPVLWRLR